MAKGQQGDLMTKKEVKVGQTYSMKHTSGLVNVKILREVERTGFGTNSKTRLHWLAENLKTGRQIEIKSAVKLGRPLSSS